MKKGLLTLLAASLVFVGCQNYDDQFDDLNAQISALKSQVDGLSSLSGQVSALSGSISGLQAGVSAAQAAASAASSAASDASAAVAAIPSVDLSGLETSLATLAAEVDAVQASLATAATATDIATLQAELDAIEADVDELLASSNVYTKDLSITSASELDAAVALGNNINIINGSVDIDQKTTMDAAKLQQVVDKIFTVTGSYNFDAQATSVTPITFNKLASTGDLTLKVNGPITASSLVTAGTITLDDTYIAKVSSINFDALTTVTAIQTDSSSNVHKITFTSATDVQLGALALYTNALNISTKKGATLDIASLDDLNAAGTAVNMSLTVSGPQDLAISNWTGTWGGKIIASNVENLTVTDYKGTIDVNSGVENVTVTGAVTLDVDGASDLETLDATTVLFADPNLSATLKAPVAYGAYGRESTITLSSTDLTSVTLNGYYSAVTSSGNSNLTTVDIDATMGVLTLTNNDALTSLDVTGSEINNVIFTGNDAITSATFDHTTELNYIGAKTDDTDVTATIKDNLELATLVWGGDNVSILTVTGNDKLTSVDFSGLAAISTKSTVIATVNIYDNDLTATATDTVDGLTTDTQYAIDGSTSAGANDDLKDKGTFDTDGGMNTLSVYLGKVLAQATAAAAVNFDTVTTLTIEEGAEQGSESSGLQYNGAAKTFEADGGGTAAPKTNWDGLVYANTKSTYESTNPTARTADAQKRAWVFDVSDLDAATNTVTLKIGSSSVTQLDNGTYGAISVDNTSNLSFLIGRLKNGASVTRAANLGATYEVYKGANAVMPTLTIRDSSTKADNGNGEGFTNAQIAARNGGDGTLKTQVTTYDKFTWTVGGRSVTASIAASAISAGSGGFVSSTMASRMIATAIAAAWNAKYGETSGTASKKLSFWSDATTSSYNVIAALTTKENAGSRPTGQTMTFKHIAANSAQVSLATTGTITETFVDYTIGSDDEELASTDNLAQAADLIISLEETVEGAISGATSASQIYAFIAKSDGSTVALVELTTSKTQADAASTVLSDDIFDADAGIYGSIYSGGTGDVRKNQTVVEGVVVESGSKRSYVTRIHWLG